MFSFLFPPLGTVRVGDIVCRKIIWGLFYTEALLTQDCVLVGDCNGTERLVWVSDILTGEKRKPTKCVAVNSSLE